MAHLEQNLKAIQDVAVLVGIPQAANGRNGEPIGNASLLYILSNGSPARGIPATPVIEPAIVADGNREIIAEELKLGAQAQLNDDAEAALVHFKRAGSAGVTASKSWFTDPRNGWPPNRPATIKRKGSDRRNIDTGDLRKKITYVMVNPPKAPSRVAKAAEAVAEVIE